MSEREEKRVVLSTEDREIARGLHEQAAKCLEELANMAAKALDLPPVDPKGVTFKQRFKISKDKKEEVKKEDLVFLGTEIYCGMSSFYCFCHDLDTGVFSFCYFS
jgi:hypothetical protein